MPLEPAEVEAIAKAVKNLGTNAVSLKLPEFWPNNPEVWFARIEAQFNTKGITQDGTKFDYLVSSLDNSTASEVEATLLHPPALDKYGALKKALLQAFAKTQVQKDSELLSLTGLGDMKPTALLRKLLSLNTDANTLMRAHFLALLPADVRTVLAGREIDDLAELAKAADRVLEARQSDALVAPVSRPSTGSTHRPAGPPASTTRRQSEHVCPNHIRYGARARSCKPWCILNQAWMDGRASPRSTPASGNSQAGR